MGCEFVLRDLAKHRDDTFVASAYFGNCPKKIWDIRDRSYLNYDPPVVGGSAAAVFKFSPNVTYASTTSQTTTTTSLLRSTSVAASPSVSQSDSASSSSSSSSTPLPSTGLSDGTTLSMTFFVLIAVGLGVCCLLFAFLYLRARRDIAEPKIEAPQQGTAVNSNDYTTTTAMNNTQQNQTYYTAQNSTSWTNMQTSLGTGTELAIPGFLQKVYPLHFTKGEFVAKGGGGQIYRCAVYDFEIKERAMNNEAVMKVVDGNGIDKMPNKAQAAFYQEISIMWRFRESKYCAQIYAFCTQPVCMVMKYYYLGDLKSYILGKHDQSCKRFTYTKSRYVTMFKDICFAISLFHSEGFVHCDLKPANILLDSDDNINLIPVITDFGISRVMDKATMIVSGFQVVEIKGASMIYAAPEVLLRMRTGQGSNGKVPTGKLLKAGDVYAIAVTLLELMKRSNAWRS